MGRLIIFIVLFTWNVSALAQDSIFLSRTITPSAGTITDFSVDNLGNLYLVMNQSQIKKINSNGDSLGVFNDTRRFSGISSIDATSGLKILVFYQDISTIVVLDRFLAIKNVIDLRKNNIQQASAIRLSYDNNIWVYDEFDSRLKKIDDNGKLLSQSADLRNVFTEAPSVESLFDEDRTLYLYDKSQGWFLFDYYGAFIRRYSYTGWNSAQVSGKSMTGITDSFFVSAETGSFGFKESRLLWPLESVLKMKTRLLNNGERRQVRYYVLFPGALTIYVRS